MLIAHSTLMEYRPTRDCERRVERYADLAAEARASGDADAADRLLLLAWAAYDDQDDALLAQEDEQPRPEAPVSKLQKR
jgi:hypothetical protein